MKHDISGDVPELAAASGPLLQMVTADVIEEIEAIFSADVRRRIVDIEVGEARIELSVDEGQLIAGEHSFPLCEIELGLKQGSTESLFKRRSGPITAKANEATSGDIEARGSGAAKQYPALSLAWTVRLGARRQALSAGHME